MGPNDAELVRVFTREDGGTIGDVTFPYDQDFQVVAEAEAGATIFGGGTKYEAGILVKDLTDGTTIYNATLPAAPPGDMGDADWPAVANQFVFTVPAVGAARESHCLQVIAYLKARVTNPDVSFAESALFIITAP